MKYSRFCFLVVIMLGVTAVGLAIVSPWLVTNKEKKVDVSANNGQIENIIMAAKGVVESEQEIEISNQVAGLISEIKVDEGEMVQKGQLLVILDDHKIKIKIKLADSSINEALSRLSELEAGYRHEDVLMAESKVKRMKVLSERAKNEYERQKRLFDGEATTLTELEKAEDRMLVTQEELHEASINHKKLLSGVREEEIEQARSCLENRSLERDYYQALLKDYAVYSPIDGLVAERYMDIGEAINAGTTILKLINPDMLRIRAELEESDVGKVVAGQVIEVFSDAYQRKTYCGNVYKVLPVLKKYSLKLFDPSASYDINAQNIYCRLDDFSGLKNGMLVTVKFLQ